MSDDYRGEPVALLHRLRREEIARYIHLIEVRESYRAHVHLVAFVEIVRVRRNFDVGRESRPSRQHGGAEKRRRRKLSHESFAHFRFVLLF